MREVLTSNSCRTGFLRDAPPVMAKLGAWSKRPPLHPVEEPSLLVTEAPDHTRYRKLVTGVFTARAVGRLRERTEAIATQLLDEIAVDVAAGRDVDLVERYCAQLPVAVISEILGVPDEEREHVLEMGTYAAGSLDMGLDWSTFRPVEGALDEFDAWLETHMERVRQNPGDDLFSKLVAARDDDEGLNDRELKSTAGLVLAAGFETTVNLLGNAIRLLNDPPDQLAHLQANPDGWGNAVDEVLRFDPPVMLTGRSAMEDVEVGGSMVRHHRMVVLLFSGANRDPAVFEDPDRFDVARANARDHLAFSAGRHFCLGAALARMEGEVGLSYLFDWFDIEVLPGARRRPTRILRGYEALPAKLSARA